MSSEHALQGEIVAGNLLCSPSTLCRHIGLLFGERVDTLFTSSDSKISGFTRPHVIEFVADLFFSTLESGLLFFRIHCRIHGMRVDGSRIRKEKVADSKISGYVWTVAVSGKKKLRIRQYPDTCGRGLKLDRNTVNVFFYFSNYLVTLILPRKNCSIDNKNIALIKSQWCFNNVYARAEKNKKIIRSLFLSLIVDPGCALVNHAFEICSSKSNC